jgi:hypothetical protein
MRRFVYKTHKWLAVGVGLFTLLWFASGIVMVLPQDILSRVAPRPGSGPASPGPPAGPSFNEVKVTVPQAIAAVEAATGRSIEVTGVSFRRLAGRLLYQIETANAGMHLVDAIAGTRVELTEDSARQMAGWVVQGRGRLREVSVLRQHDSRYSQGPLPAYRISVDDPTATILYIPIATGEIRVTTRPGRIRSFLVGTHTFQFLRPILSERSVRIGLVGMSIVGLLLSVFGFWILWIQLTSWWRRRQEIA